MLHQVLDRTLRGRGDVEGTLRGRSLRHYREELVQHGGLSPHLDSANVALGGTKLEKLSTGKVEGTRGPKPFGASLQLLGCFA
jgi:hypothetical protein